MACSVSETLLLKFGSWLMFGNPSGFFGHLNGKKRTAHREASPEFREERRI